MRLWGKRSEVAGVAPTVGHLRSRSHASAAGRRVRVEVAPTVVRCPGSHAAGKRRRTVVSAATPRVGHQMGSHAKAVG
jgi:hypothetical protein